MGLEVQVLEEFWPITPVRTHALAARKGLSCSQLQNEEEEDDCHTPTSPSRTLRTPLECPPAPKKPRRAVASVEIAPPPPPPPPSYQSFFQVPHDLACVFFPPPSSIPRTSSKKPLNLTTVIDS